jgi:hypothetical protein
MQALVSLSGKYYRQDVISGNIATYILKGGHLPLFTVLFLLM